MQGLVLALNEKFKQMENMMKKVEEKSLVWVGEEQTEKQTRYRCLMLTVKYGPKEFSVLSKFSLWGQKDKASSAQVSSQEGGWEVSQAPVRLGLLPELLIITSLPLQELTGP